MQPSFSSTQPTCPDSARPETSSVNELIKYAKDTPGLRGRGALERARGEVSGGGARGAAWCLSYGFGVTAPM